MADLEAVLADVSYLMAMEKSKCTPAARASKKIVLPDPRYDAPMHVDPLTRTLLLLRPDVGFALRLRPTSQTSVLRC